MAAPTTKQHAARALHLKFVRDRGGQAKDITLVAGTGLVVGVYQWTDAQGNVASTGWEAATTQAAATERAGLGL